MSATLPPAADFDRASDFGEFWRHAETAQKPTSVMPESELDAQELEAEEEVRLLPLSPEQHARRIRLRRAVGGVVLGLFAFTAFAGCIYLVRGRAAASTSASATKPIAVAAHQVHRAEASSFAPAASALTAPPAPPLSATDQALALVHAPAATVASLQAWSRLAGQLSLADRRLAEHDLSRLSVTGARPLQEAARLELALLWRATARRGKAQKVLVSLARTATDPVVKKYALEALTSA
jgi:hypothetical protein